VAGSVIGAALFPQKGPKPQKEDLTIQAASYGTPISILAGTDRAAGALIWVKGNKLDRRKVEQGGKGFMGGGVTTYQYYASFAVLIGEGPIDGVRRIWADTKLIYNKSAASLSSILASDGQIVTHISGIDGDQRVYLGTETQTPDPSIQADRGADNVSAYRGLAYIVFDDLPLANFANRIPNISVEYVKDGTLSYLKRDLVDTEPTDPSGTAANLTLDPYQPYLWGLNQSGILVRYDLTNATPTAKVSNGDDNFGVGSLAVDEFGNVYIPATSGSVWCYRYDAITLAKTGQAAVLDGAGGSGWTVRYVSGPGFRWLTLFFNGFVLLVDAAAMTQMTRLATTTNSDLPHALEGAPVATPDGVLWHVANGGGSYSRVIRIDLVVDVSEPLGKRLSGAVDADVTAAHGTSIAFCQYYADEDCLVIAGGTTISKYDYAAASIIATLTLSEGIGESHVSFRRGPINGKLWVKTGGNPGTMREIDLATMTELRSIDVGLWGGSSSTDDFGYDPTTDSFILQQGVSQRTQQFFLPRIDPLDVDRADVIADYSARAGLTESQINVSLVTDTIQGNTIRRQTTARDALEPILQSGFLDAVDVDAKVKFVPRGQSVTLTVPEDDLGAALWGEGGEVEKLIQTIPQEINRPERVLIRHSDRDAQYDTGAQAAKRPREIISSREQMTFDTAEVMSGTTAMQLAERLLYSLWAETPVKFSLPPKYRKLTPTDVITIPYGSLSFRVRIDKIDDGPYLACDGMVEEAAAYTSTATGGETNIPEQVLQLLSPTQLFLIDSNLIRDEDDDGGHYLGIAPTVPDGLWDGAQIFKSSDNVSFQASTSFDTAVEWGSATNALADHHCTTTDRWNTLTVQMVNGELASVTEAEMLNGENAFLLQSGDDWELIQAADVTDLGGGKYELSTLLRGRRGTEQSAGGHAAGDKFIVLSVSTMQRLTSDAEVDLARYYKAVTFGALFTATGAVEFTNTARGRECYAPAHVKGTRDGSNNLTITWKRRDRIGGELDWNDGVTDVPMSESSEAYVVEIYDDATLKRTISGLSSETASYSAADQTTDGLTPGDPIDCIVYQISAANSRGRPAEATV
jgi:hypothetical protein